MADIFGPHARALFQGLDVGASEAVMSALEKACAAHEPLPVLFALLSGASSAARVLAQQHGHEPNALIVGTMQTLAGMLTDTLHIRVTSTVLDLTETKPVTPADTRMTAAEAELYRRGRALACEMAVEGDPEVVNALVDRLAPLVEPSTPAVAAGALTAMLAGLSSMSAEPPVFAIACATMLKLRLDAAPPPAIHPQPASPPSKPH